MNLHILALVLVSRILSIYASTLANATLYTLCRNSDIYELLETIVNYEARFNHQFHYDWVFLNDKPFDESFKLLVSNAVSGSAKFGQIDTPQMWDIPSSVDLAVMERNIMHALNDPEGAYPYADSRSYRSMCRFESGYFQWHELLLDYDYFWRVEPCVKLHCDINYDIFKSMIDNEIDYGFTISLLEYEKTVPTLFDSFYNVLEDLNKTDLLNSSENYSNFIYDSNRNSYNLCHFWTNFEIGNLNVFRSDEYTEMFNRIDEFNGFFYERWGDAPVRTLILSTILNKPSIQRLKNLGYENAPYLQCPQDMATRIENRCSCDIDFDVTDNWFSCSWFFDQLEDNHIAQQ